jgi:peptidoglycan-N-acetylglucosamine deacetylase
VAYSESVAISEAPIVSGVATQCTTRQCVLTTSWDDGHPLDLRVANLLAKYGLTGTFYVPFETGHPVLSPQNMRDLAKNFEIGAHTVHHIELPKVSDSVAGAEICESKVRLEEITGRRCEMFCAPKGRFRKRHLRMIREIGFLGMRTVELLSIDRPVSVDGLAVVPTTVQAYSHGLSAYAKNCLRQRQAARLCNLFRHSWSKGWDLIAIRFLEQARENGGVFHVWGHSREIEAGRQWDALGRLLELMGQVAKEAACVPNSGVCRNAS